MNFSEWIDYTRERTDYLLELILILNTDYDVGVIFGLHCL